MKRFLFLSMLLSGVSIASFAQKKPLDHSVYDSWQTVQAVKISNDGKIVSWQVNPQEGDNKLYIKNLSTGTQFFLDRASKLSISEDGRYAVCTIIPPFAVTRQAKIDKKKKEDMPKDTLAYINLKTFAVMKFAVASSSASGPGSVMGYETAPYVFISQDAKNLLVLNTAAGIVDTLKNVGAFKVSRFGDKLAVVFKKDQKDSLSKNYISMIDFTSKDTVRLSEGKKDYTALAFNDADDKFVFEATDQEEKKDGSPRYSIFLTDEVILKKAARKAPAVKDFRTSEIISQDCPGLPDGWIISKDSSPRFSNNSSRLVLKLNKYLPAKDTTIMDFESAQLDVWRWDSKIIPPMSKSSSASSYRDELSAIVNLDKPSAVLTLSQNPSDGISFLNGADCDVAFSFDSHKYDISSMWLGDNINDISVVNLKDGSRKLLKEAFAGYAKASDGGRYLVWFGLDDGAWHCMDVATKSEVNLTAQAGTNFYDEEDDHSGGYQPYAYPKWTADDQYVLLQDRYDIWRITPDGKNAVNLTKGAGRSAGIQYRYTDIRLHNNPYLYSNSSPLPLKDKIYLTAFDEKTRKNGFATLGAVVPAVPVTFTDTVSVTQAVQAKNSRTIAFLKGNFRNPMDLYLSSDDGKTQTRLTSINPQQSDYVWGNVQLVSWKAYDGKELKGLLYTPDNLDRSKKYPMMVYFYERSSETLYDYYSPAPSRSIICIPFYVSRGYVVFVPDIVYKVGHPGESAYNCICSGAEAMCSQFQFIDKSRMAIQGQSWGGYQTAYLVTRTNMFAAAGAGAPVGNMTSAYGGIRWESGNSRISQYEHGQSRIGKTLWEDGGRDLYIENSPVFFAPNVQTPVLIMHNDADGAVPWYQGIEFFMSLRRLGKPAWLLEYNNEAHNLVERRNCKDLSIRLQQFFDHYLQGAPMPDWMKTGIPYERKGNYYGLGFTPDSPSGNTSARSSANSSGPASR